MSFMSVEHLVVFLQTGFLARLGDVFYPYLPVVFLSRPTTTWSSTRTPSSTRWRSSIMVNKRLTEVQKGVAHPLLSEGYKQQDVADKLWRERTPTSYLRKLSDSMPRRLQQVIDANANMTKY